MLMSMVSSNSNSSDLQMNRDTASGTVWC
jgi:hypothetical protein